MKIKKYNNLKSVVAFIIIAFMFFATGGQGVAEEDTNVVDENVEMESNAPEPQTQPLAGEEETITGTAGVDSSVPTPQVQQFSGAASYAIPISVTPGRGGLTPALSLSYSSSNKGDILGPGWGIGLGSIQRSTKKGLDYNGNDFLVNGEELVPLAVDPSGFGSYQAKIEGAFSKFTYQTDGGGWKVTTKDGRNFYYGSNNYSRKTKPESYDPKIFEWYLDKVEDTNGNYYEVEYEKRNEHLFLKKIAYNFKDPQTPFSEIEFYYDASRPNNILRSLADWMEDIDSRLKSIVVKADGRVVRAYGMGYKSTLSDANQSYLEKVTLYGDNASVNTEGTISNGSSKILSEMVYNNDGCFFEDPVNNGPAIFSNYEEEVDSPMGGTLEISVPHDLSRVRLGDFNGDGRMDIAYIEGFSSTTEEELSVYLSNGNGSFSTVYHSELFFRVDDTTKGSKVDLARLKLGDFNGDGKTDIARVRGYGTTESLQVHFSQGDGTFNTITSNISFFVYGSTTRAPIDLARFLLGDYDGDGKTDIAWVDGWGTSNKPLKVYLSNGNGTFEQVSNPGINFCVHDDPIGRAGVDLARFKLGDYNGDGRTDIASVRGYGDTPETLLVHLAQPDGTFETIDTGIAFHVEGTSTGAPVDLERFKLGDYNGDGKTDMAWVDGWGEREPLQVYLSKGDGTFWNVSNPGIDFLVDNSIKGASLDLARFKLGDYNGDGRTDIAWVESLGTIEKTLKVFLANGNGTFKSIDTGLTISVQEPLTKARIDLERILSGDFNGDGKADLARVNCWNDNEATTMYLTSGQPSNSLQKITNAFGGSTTITYTPSSNTGSPSFDLYSKFSMPFVFPLATTITTNDGIESPVSTTYSYSGGYYDRSTKDFRGFEKVIQKLPDGTSIETQFHQDEYRKGRAVRLSHKDKDDIVLSQTDFEWKNNDIQENAFSKFVSLESKTIKTYDLSDTNTPLSTFTFLKEAYTYYANHGGLLTVTKTGTGKDETTGDSIVLTYEYGNFGDWMWRVTLEKLEGVIKTKPKSRGVLRQTTYGYEYSTGNLTDKELWNDSGAPIKTSMGYDSYGNLAYSEDGDGNRVTHDYDTTIHVYRTQTTLSPVKNSAATDLITKFPEADIYMGLGLPKKSIDENENVTERTYDAFGRVKTISLNDKERENYTYDDTSLPRKVTSNKILVYSSILPSILPSTVYYDGFNRVIQATSNGMDGSQVTFVSRKVRYDNMGRNYLTAGPIKSSDSRFIGVNNFQWTAYPYIKKAYDLHGRETSVETLDGVSGAIKAYVTYSGLETVFTDPDGKIQKRTADCFGNLTIVTEVNDDTEYDTKYEYNGAGDLLYTTQSVSGVDVVTEIKYNSLGQKVWMKDPNMGTWQYTYDNIGNLKTQTSPVGEKTEMTYDGINRLKTKKFFKNSQENGSPVTFEYDLTSTSNGKGRLCKVSNVTTATVFNKYDELGNVEKQTDTIGTDVFITQYDYNRAGMLTKITYPDSLTANYKYYQHTTFPKSVDSGGTPYAEITEYDISGKIGQMKYGNNATTNYIYDPYSARLQSISSTGNDTFQSLNYTYTLAGDIREVISGSISGSNTYTYTYDDLHRLITERKNGSESVGYTYNELGTITSKSSNGQTLDYLSNDPNKPPHAVHQIKGPLPGPSGLTKRVITYNPDSMPLTITDTKNGSTSVQAFAYDGNGRRVKKTWGNKSKIYVGDHYEVYKEGGQTIVTQYIFLGGQRVAMIKGGVTFYFHQDHLGSVTALTEGDTDLNNAVSEYMPFGENRNEIIQNSDYQFTDQETDSETGLYNYDARLYDPAVGMFLTADTIVPDWTDPQTMNRYSYCRNNPVMFVDPSGHIFLVDDIIVGAAIGAWVGGMTSAVTGGDIGQGMLTGAIGGAFFGAAGAFNAGPLGHAIAGASSEGVNSAIAGGDIGMGMLIGGISGGFGKYADPFIGENFGAQLLGRSVIGGITGGISAELYGGSFADGFINGAKTGAIGFLCNDFVHEGILYSDDGIVIGEPGLDQPMLDPIDVFAIAASFNKVGFKAFFSPLRNQAGAVGNDLAISSVKKLSNGEIKKLIKAGYHPHELKPNARFDLFKDQAGNIMVKPKSGIGPGDPTGLNIKNF